MSLPSSYLMNFGKVNDYFDAILNAEPPDRFTYKFLENLGFSSSNDRLLIGVLKEIGFLDQDGVPQDRYYRFLDRDESARVLAEGLKDSYSDLFAVNTAAHELSAAEAENKLRTLYAGNKTDLIIKRVAKTLEALAEIADFSEPTIPKSSTKSPKPDSGAGENPKVEETKTDAKPPNARPRISVEGLQYHINLILPESRDQAVYDALFRSLREHLG